MGVGWGGVGVKREFIWEGEGDVLFPPISTYIPLTYVFGPDFTSEAVIKRMCPSSNCTGFRNFCY